MAITKIGPDPLELGTGVSTIHTVSSGPSKQTLLMELEFFNNSAADATPTVCLVPSGQSAGDLYEIIGRANSVLKEGERQIYRIRQFLETGDSIQWKADIANVITAWFGAVEQDEDLAKYRNVDAQFLGTSLATLLTVGANRQATMIEVILHNIDTANRFATVHIIPNGGSASDANMIIGGTGGESLLRPGETHIHLLNLMRGASVFIQAKADAASMVTAKISSLEEAV